MSTVKRLIGMGAVVALALGVGAGPAWADHDRGWRKAKHHDKRHHGYYRPAPDVVVIERRVAPRVVYVEPRPRVVYVERPPVYARPEITIVFPLRF